MKMNNKTYDILSIVSRIVLPLSVLITSLGDIWNLPYCKQIALTLCAIDVFLGSILVDSSRKYKEELESTEE